MKGAARKLSDTGRLSVRFASDPGAGGQFLWRCSEGVTAAAMASTSSRPPISISSTKSTLAGVLLPLLGRPVKNTVNPCLLRGG